MTHPTFDGPGPDQQFHDELAAGRFAIQQCDACRSFVFHPRVVCPACGAILTRWVAPSGKGRVYSCSTVRRKANEGGDHNVSLIDLDEGPRMMSRVEDIAPEKVFIGMPVEARVRQVGGKNLVVFVPSAESAG